MSKDNLCNACVYNFDTCKDETHQTMKLNEKGNVIACKDFTMTNK